MSYEINLQPPTVEARPRGLHDGEERLVAYCSYDLDLNPKELDERFQNILAA